MREEDNDGLTKMNLPGPLYAAVQKQAGKDIVLYQYTCSAVEPVSVVALYAWGVCSKLPSRCLKLWIALNPI